MRFSKVWTVASKDFKTFGKKKSILFGTIGFLVFVSIGLPLIVRFVGEMKGGVAALPATIDAVSWWFVTGAALIPTSIASYSIIGEKVQKSLEPLLATPTTDEEVLAGKGIAALVPSMASTYIGSVIFMFLVDGFTFGKLRYLYLPNWNICVILLLLAPLACMFSIGMNVMISARANDVRTAQQLGILTILPFGAVFALSQNKMVSLTITNLFMMSAVLFAIDIAIFYLVKSTFNRNEILTKWR